MLDDFISVRKRQSAIRLVLYYVSFICVSICIQSFSEASTLPDRQDTFKQVCFDLAKYTDVGIWMFSQPQECSSKRLGNVIEFFSEIAPQTEAIPKEQAKQKRDESNNDILFHWLFPVFTFFAGLFASGYFSERTYDKGKPNVEVTGAARLYRAASG